VSRRGHNHQRSSLAQLRHGRGGDGPYPRLSVVITTNVRKMVDGTSPCSTASSREVSVRSHWSPSRHSIGTPFQKLAFTRRRMPGTPVSPPPPPPPPPPRHPQILITSSFGLEQSLSKAFDSAVGPRRTLTTNATDFLRILPTVVLYAAQPSFARRHLPA
jgi:hypothetical protein